MGYYYDRKGNEIDSKRWAALKEDHSYVVVARDTLPGGYRVSTVWLGIDHGLGCREEKQIFETMVFPPSDLSDLMCERYATEAEAIEGHRHVYESWFPRALCAALEGVPISLGDAGET